MKHTDATRIEPGIQIILGDPPMAKVSLTALADALVRSGVYRDPILLTSERSFLGLDVDPRLHLASTSIADDGNGFYPHEDNCWLAPYANGLEEGVVKLYDAVFADFTDDQRPIDSNDDLLALAELARSHPWVPIVIALPARFWPETFQAVFGDSLRGLMAFSRSSDVASAHHGWPGALAPDSVAPTEPPGGNHG